MSGVFPISAGFETLDFQSNTNSRVTVSVSGRSQRLKSGEQFWSFKLKSPGMTRAEVMADFAFIVAQDGQVESFTIVPPTISSTRGSASGTVTVTQAYAAGLKTVRANGGSGTLKTGDLIKFSNHDKVYMLTADVNMDASSEDTIAFYPPLTTAVTSSTTITYNSVPLKVYLDKDQQKYNTQANNIYKYEITLNEEI